MIQNKPVDESDKGSKENGTEENLCWEEIRTEHLVQDEWIDFRRSAYRFPDGQVFEPFYTYSRRDYVVIVATDPEGNYICVRQFRQGIGEVTTEFPAGGIERSDGKEYRSSADARNSEDGGKKSAGAEKDTGKKDNGFEVILDACENALDAAKRELLEETGYVSEEWKHLLTVPSNATIADNYAYVFSAVNCRKAEEQSLDETEFLNVRKHSPDTLKALIREGGFQQAVHIMAWLLQKSQGL